MREQICDIDKDDLDEYRRLHVQRECGIMYNVRMTLEDAADIELAYIEFQAYIIEKYLAGEDLEDRDWHIDEITGEIYVWEQL